MNFYKIIFLLAVGQFTTAATFNVTPDKGTVSFLAKGKPALISIKGEGQGADGTLTEKADNTLSGKFAFNLKTLKTGIELRDEHLKNKYLEVEKYPQAILNVDGLKLPQNLNDEFKFQGVLSLHGVEKTVEGKARIKSGKELSADFQLKLSEFGIETPSFQGITVAENVQVMVNVPFVKSE